jgi:para-aminobenzoate synthetase
VVKALITRTGMSIGAGGAITWLSENTKEWEEVLVKVRSVVGEVEAT